MNKKLEITPSITPMETVIVAKTGKEAVKEKLKELIAEETKMVTGIFQCFETPGSTQTISVRKYPGIEPFKMTMTDGCMYEIPLYVARFLNGKDVSAGALGDPNKRNTNIGTCSYGVSGFKMDHKGAEPSFGLESSINGGAATVVPTVGITKRVRRYGFQSTEFGAT